MTIMQAIERAANLEANDFLRVLRACGFDVVPKGDADQLDRIRRKMGGMHPMQPGLWQVSAASGWVSLSAGREKDQPGMFSPGEAREIAMALIIFAEQAERERRF